MDSSGWISRRPNGQPPPGSQDFHQSRVDHLLPLVPTFDHDPPGRARHFGQRPDCRRAHRRRRRRHRRDARHRARRPAGAARPSVRPRAGLGVATGGTRRARRAARPPARRRPPGAGPGHRRRHARGRRGGHPAPDRRWPSTAPTSCAPACCVGRSPARTRGASCSASPGPARTWPASPAAPFVTATSGSSTGRRCGPPTPTCATGRCSSPAPIRISPSIGGSPTSGSTCARRASRSARCGR